MAEVIDLHRRKARERRVKKARADRRAQAVAAALSCGICPRRCAFCGLPAMELTPQTLKIPYPFCEACFDEHQAFQNWQEGDQGDGVFWHTKEWAQMWRTWLAAMEAGQGFRSSPAFQKLMSRYTDD